SQGTIPTEDPEQKTSRNAVIAIFRIGRMNSDCKKFGFCGIKGGGKTVNDGELRALISKKGDGKLLVVFMRRPSEEGPTLYIDEDITTPPALARRLGFKSVTLSKGEYAYNKGMCVINAKLDK